jgi:NAD(P)-dependent dehydrogenase (short-subunit alcohol dehydrogenase family)
MPSVFEGKGFLVTGGAEGFGRDIVAAAVSRRAVVAFSGRPGTEEAASTLMAELRRAGAEGRACGFSADVSRETDVERLFEDALARLPGLHAVVMTTETLSPPMGPLAESPLAAWDAAVASALRAGFLVARRAIEAFLGAGEGGRIVTVAPLLREGAGGQAGAAMVQGAIASLTRSIAKEYGRRGISCNGVAPVARHPPEFAGPPGSLVETVLFLASTDASYVNGETLRVVPEPGPGDAST